MDIDNHIDELLARHFAKEALTAEQQAELDAWIAANSDERKPPAKTGKAAFATGSDSHVVGSGVSADSGGGNSRIVFP